MTTLTTEKLTEMFTRPDPVEAEITRRLGAGCIDLWDGDTTSLAGMTNLDLLAAAATRIAGRRADLLELHQEALANKMAWQAFAGTLEEIVQQQEGEDNRDPDATDPPTIDRIALARVIYEAKKQDAWGNWQSEYRKAWPATAKDLRRCLQNQEDIGVTFALAQADAVIGYLSEFLPEAIHD